MEIEDLHDLFVGELREIYNAERQLATALPQMARDATHQELRAVINNHLLETREQVERLEKVFGMVGQEVVGATCEAMKGLVAEAGEFVDDAKDSAVRDAGLIATCQKVEHYEIASYGCLATWAKKLGFLQAADLLNETLEEEKLADANLNALALKIVNQEALEGGAGMAAVLATRDKSNDATHERFPG